MGSRDPRVDAYIAEAPAFAKPILKHIREAVHAGCPDVEETIKWRMPTFEYKGILCGMAGFKKHAALGFWKSKLILTKEGKPADASWGDFGRVTQVSQLPAKRVMAGYVRQAAALNEQGIGVKRVKKPKPALPVPADLTSALRRTSGALASFKNFPPGHRREYVEWITEAKTDATRERRIATAVEWIAKGRSRSWKYERRA
ncbi:MAG: YdeI/OmpD-associated family protein [Candidatus Eisenbacteria bacterium]|nr:YdeI/OmpD-associated family protein [Candidatus Eisenbacteria bacterium]